MTVNFEYKWNLLQAANPETDTEWSWEKGDREIVISHGGQNVGTLSVPDGATVTEVKAIIRTDAKRAR